MWDVGEKRKEKMVGKKRRAGEEEEGAVCAQVQAESRCARGRRRRDKGGKRAREGENRGGREEGTKKGART